MCEKTAYGYCHLCSKYTCSECLILNHKNHINEIKELKVIIDLQKNEIKNLETNLMNLKSTSEQSGNKNEKESLKANIKEKLESRITIYDNLIEQLNLLKGEELNYKKFLEVEIEREYKEFEEEKRIQINPDEVR